jgi:hypothetical protein
VDGGAVLHNVTNDFDAGAHTVSEDGLAGYAAGSWGGDCAADGTITLALDQDAVCTITNESRWRWTRMRSARSPTMTSHRRSGS